MNNERDSGGALSTRLDAVESDFAIRKLTVCGTKSGGRCLESFKPQIDLD